MAIGCCIDERDKMHLSIRQDNLPRLKRRLMAAAPASKPSHRMEALAHAVGHRSYASLRAAIAAAPAAVTINDQAFCSELALPMTTTTRHDDVIPHRPVSRAVSGALLHDVLDRVPDLTQRGFDNIWIDQRDRRTSITEMEADLQERRREAYESNWSVDQFELAMIFLSKQGKVKTVNRDMSSYGLKHRAERLSRGFGMFEHLGDYVSNGMFIAASYAAGFIVKRIDRSSYNARLNISKRTLRFTMGSENDEDQVNLRRHVHATFASDQAAMS